MAFESPNSIGTNESEDVSARINQLLEMTMDGVLNECYDLPTNDQMPNYFVTILNDNKDEVLAWNPGDKDALEKAILARRTILDALGPGPDRIHVFEPLAMLQVQLYAITKDITDLEQAVEFGNELEYWIIDDENSSTALGNLASLYLQRFEATGTAEDLDRAITFAERSVQGAKQASEQGIKVASVLFILTHARLRKYHLTDSVEDLQEVLLKGSMTMSQIPPNRPDWFSLLCTSLMHLLPVFKNRGGDNETYFRVLRSIARVDHATEDMVVTFARNLERSEIRSILDDLPSKSPEKTPSTCEEEEFIPEKRLDPVGHDNRVQVRQLPSLMILDPRDESGLHVDNFPISRPEQLETIMHAVVGSPRGDIGEFDNEEREVTELKDCWQHSVDNDFATDFFHRLPQSEVIENLPDFSKLCTRCSEFLSNLLNNEGELVLAFTKLADLSAEDCVLCDRLRQISVLPEPLRMFREGSCLKVEGHGVPKFRLYKERGSNCMSHEIQIFSPSVVKLGSNGYYQLLRDWIQDCDKHHQCLHSVQCEGHASTKNVDNKQEDETHDTDSEGSDTDRDEVLEWMTQCRFERDELLPTRVIDVGLGKKADTLKLYTSGRGERAKYITLSHCWGKLDQTIRDKYCTYICNYERRLQGIEMDDLPQTFRDAVTVTRELGIQYLWIDSICIIQPHHGCSTPHCTDQYDWTSEGKKMERYYGCSYCTLAASSATDSTQGFLHDRSLCNDFRIRLDSIGDLYLSETVDDFDRDVSEAPLNKRGWVFQERVLSRRTIHFAKQETFWECGDSVRCETMTKLQNPRAGLLGDAHFPRLIQGYTKSNRIRLFQSLFETYTRLGLSQHSDRSVAIAGLLKRLGGDLNAKVRYGILDRFLHRCLLWRRSTSSNKWGRILYRESAQVPSWSWMAYDGEITFDQVPFYKVDWNRNIFHPSKNYRSDEETPEHARKPERDIPKEEVPEHAQKLGLKAWARAFSPTAAAAELTLCAQELSWDLENRGTLVFDEDRKNVEIGVFKCIILGRMRENENSDEQRHFILVVEKERGLEHTYKRVGIGSVQKRDISFEEAESVWII